MNIPEKTLEIIKENAVTTYPNYSAIKGMSVDVKRDAFIAGAKRGYELAMGEANKEYQRLQRVASCGYNADDYQSENSKP